MSPIERITAYFTACGEGTAEEIAAHFTPDAVIYDTNIKPARGNEDIGRMWVKVRQRWGGASWAVESAVVHEDAAAIEWAMSGVSTRGRSFTFRGSEHYHFEDTLISEIRQYWTFDPDLLDTALVEFDYD